MAAQPPHAGQPPHQEVTDATTTAKRWSPAPETIARWAVPGIPALLAFCFSMVGLENRQLWWDELATKAYSTASWQALARVFEDRDIVFAPYYTLMHGWIVAFGEGTTALRLPSVIAVACAAGLTAAVGRKVFDARTGLVAGTLFAILPSVSRYGQEVRPYAGAIAAAALASLLLLRAAERPTWSRWVAYGAGVALVGWAHLISLSILLAHAAFLGVAWWRERDRRLLRWLAAVAPGLLPVLPMILLGFGQRGQVSWIKPATWDRFVAELVGITGAERVGAFVLALAVIGCWAGERRTGGRRVALLAVWSGAPFLLLYLAAPQVQMLHHRYLLFTLPAWCVLAAAAVSRAGSAAVDRTGTRLLVPAVVLGIVFTLGLPTQGSVRAGSLPNEPDLRAAAGVIAAERRAGDLIAYAGASPWAWQLGVTYYLPAGADLPEAFSARTGTTATFTSTCDGMAACRDRGGRIWLVNSHPRIASADALAPALESALRENFTTVKTVKLLNLKLTLLEPRPPA
jgi:mannosyltransferase